MARRSFLEVIGVIENMSAFTCDHGESYALFGEGGGQALADAIDAPLLGKVPLEAAVAAGGDAGDPVSLAGTRRRSGRVPLDRRADPRRRSHLRRRLPTSTWPAAPRTSTKQSPPSPSPADLHEEPELIRSGQGRLEPRVYLCERQHITRSPLLTRTRATARPGGLCEQVRPARPSALTRTGDSRRLVRTRVRRRHTRSS